LEGRLRRLRRLGHAAHLAHVLQRRGADLFGRRRRHEVVEDADVPAHDGSSMTYLGRSAAARSSGLATRPWVPAMTLTASLWARTNSSRTRVSAAPAGTSPVRGAISMSPW